MDRNRWGNNAQIASAVIALFGFVILIFQAWTIQKNFKATAARQVYMSYSESTLQTPELTEPDYPKLRDGDPKEFIRYKNFVSNMLFAYDEILGAYDEPEWRRAFNEEIAYHLPYLCTYTDQNYDLMFFPKMRETLRQVRSRCPDVIKKMEASAPAKN
jgi:hypothetical protein